ncbi:MAG: N-acetyltransferase [Pseudomonadota bacterium]|nr:N-acetyltransferase [Pseudomonadota bacterium]
MFDPAAIRYRPEEASDLDAIEAITDEAFGPGRYTRAAERVRELAAYDPALSYVADFGGEIVGSVRQTKIGVGDAPALMLGPLAVRPFLKGKGIGKALMRRAAQGAAEAGETVILLVGDQPYYWGLGYRPVLPGRIQLPRPVDPTRLLALELVPRATLTLTGPVCRR